MSNTAAPMPGPGMVAWESPANIALVKYWGKYPLQLPMNPSVSFVLRESVVRLRLTYVPGSVRESGLRAFSLNGKPNEQFRERIAGFLESLYGHFPFLRGMELSIQSESTFPHSAGIASSAAAFSALALCLCEMEWIAKNEVLANQGADLPVEPKNPNASPTESSYATPLSDPDFVRRASYIARLGSGSACRSLESGFVVWGKTPYLDEAHDEYGLKLHDGAVAKEFYTLRDAVLIADDTSKKVSSSAGHALMHEHPYREARRLQAQHNLGTMLDALREGNEPLFFSILENEALSLHSLMMSSNPGYILMKPQTITLLDKIRDFRAQTGISMGFTMDAGPNIHLIYFNRDKNLVRAFVDEELSPLCCEGRWIDDAMGNGPKKI